MYNGQLPLSRRLEFHSSFPNFSISFDAYDFHGNCYMNGIVLSKASFHALSPPAMSPMNVSPSLSFSRPC